jgi:hypothetical protein
MGDGSAGAIEARPQIQQGASLPKRPIALLSASIWACVCVRLHRARGGNASNGGFGLETCRLSFRLALLSPEGIDARPSWMRHPGLRD